MSQNPPPCDEHVFVANNADGISTAAKALKSGTIVGKVMDAAASATA